jgi:hypothetical protein
MVPFGGDGGGALTSGPAGICVYPGGRRAISADGTATSIPRRGPVAPDDDDDGRALRQAADVTANQH